MMHIHRFSCGALCRRVAPPLRHPSLTPPLLPTSPALSFRLSFCSYVRFNTRLDACAYKEIWKAFDTSEGVEVAWNTLFLEEEGIPSHLHPFARVESLPYFLVGAGI